jgi:hypothetical protein
VGAWLGGAFSQFLFGVSSLTIFLPRIAPDTGLGGRGFASFATEPSFYAAACILLLVLNEFFYLQKRYNIKLYIGLFLVLLLQIILSYSGVGIMMLILFGCSKLFEVLFIKEDRKRKFLALGIIILITLSVLLFFNDRLLGGKRAGVVLKQSVSNPVSLVDKDYSVSNRLMNPVVGIYGGVVETKGLGFGVGSKEKGPVPSWLSKLRGIETRFGGKIEGGLVQSIYELGFMGIFYVILVLGIVVMSIFRNSKMRPALITSACAIFAPMFIWGSLAIPLLGYILGIHLYYLYNLEK